MKIATVLCILILTCFSCSKKEMVDTPMDGEMTMDTMSMDTIPIDPIVPDTIRFASYNVSLFGNEEGKILSELENAAQFVKYIRLATVIQEVAPDVLVLMEVDYHPDGEVINLFRKNALEVKHTEAEPITYPYAYQIISNTGILSSVDIDDNGSISLPNDAYGFGNYEGQYASAILSKYPLDVDNIRSFQNFKWKDMPDAALPKNADGTNYYSDEVLDVFRVSSKNHIDIPIMISDNQTVHSLISHPTPPVFDGAEDRNGKRNHDEIRLWADYISGADYLVDDNGISGGLDNDDSFIVFGDLNADPIDGDSYNSAINQLLNNDKVHQAVANGALIPASNGGAEHNKSNGDQGDPKFDTAFFGLRIDYVLPSDDLNPIASGVYWPDSTEPGYEVIKDGAASDHLLVWLDVVF